MGTRILFWSSVWESSSKDVNSVINNNLFIEEFVNPECEVLDFQALET